MKKVLFKIPTLLMVFALSACFDSSKGSLPDSGGSSGGGESGGGSSEGITPSADSDKTGKDAFLPDDTANFEVAFFDVDNVINSEGQIDENHSCVDDLRNTNNNADCYLVKSGNTEILFDCGSQQNYGTDENRTKNFCRNIYKKIVTYCTDGVLDYLIVTHADKDHIMNLQIEGGLFDSIIKPSQWLTDYYQKYNEGEEKVTDIYGNETAQLTKIGTIIDFDSYRVRYNSTNPAVYEEYRLITSLIYQKYQKKRDKLISDCGSKYCPASYFFSSVTGSTADEKNHNYYAIPDDYFELLQDKGNLDKFKTITGDTLLDMNTGKEYPEEAYPNVKKGLTEYKVGDTSRYTFDINLEKNTTLKILYNWYYDSYYSPNVTQYGRYNEGTMDEPDPDEPTKPNYSQPHNNISVCSLVECGKSKLLLTGDVGVYAEDALMNYYQGTDVLSNITCYKASHHGSTHQRKCAPKPDEKGNPKTTYGSENSKELFDMIAPQNQPIDVICTSVAQPKRDFYKKDVVDDDGRDETQLNDAMYKSLNSVAVIDNKLIQNMSDIKYNLYATQIAKGINYEEDKYQITNMPFYGDIHVIFTASASFVRHDFSGEITTYIKKTVGVDDPLYKFKTNNKPIEELEWAKKVELL